MSFKRISAIGGFAFVVLIVVNIILLGSQPGPDDSVEKITDYLAEDRQLHKVAAYIGYLVLLPAVVFFAGLVALVRVSDREHDEAWGTAVLISALGLASTAAVGDALVGSLFLRAGLALDPGTVRGLWDAQYVAYASGAVAITALTASVAVPVFVHRLLPAWYGVLSLVVALLGLVALFATVSRSAGEVLFIVGFVPFLVWALVTSVLMFQDSAGAAQRQ